MPGQIGQREKARSEPSHPTFLKSATKEKKLSVGKGTMPQTSNAKTRRKRSRNLH